MATTFDTAIVGGRVAVPPFGVRPLDLVIADGKVAALLEPGTPIKAERTIDAGQRFVLPGLIDPHTHIGYESGRGMPLDALAAQFESETRSALIGGVTTVLDTYRNPASYLGIFGEMRSAGEANSYVDFSYNLGILHEEHSAEIPRYYAELGISSFKFYMAYRSSDAHASGNADNRYTDALLYQSMRHIADLPNAIAMVHAENLDICEAERHRLMTAGRRDLAAWTESRPDYAEAEAVHRAAYFAGETGCPLYVAHVSSSKALAAGLDRRARTRTPVYLEVCGHHLTQTRECVHGIVAKVNPPLRDDADRDALWSALGAGELDTVGSDHAAVRVADKQPTIWEGGPGLPGVAMTLPVLVEGLHAGLVSIHDIAMSAAYRTAQIFGLYPAKGTLQVGSDADLCIVDLGHARRVDTTMLQSRADFTLYEGQSMRGWPDLTMVRGTVVMEDGAITVPAGHGRLVPRQGRPNP